MAKAYGQITIVDIGDLGQLSVYPSSNKPYSVIYDPNAKAEQLYKPNWKVEHLILKPIIYYGDKVLTYESPGIVIQWYKDGSTSPMITSTSEQISNGQLTVTDNILTPVTKMVTYTCKIIYTEPSSGAVLKAEGKITFTLIEQPTVVKSINITGSNVFLYRGDKTLEGPNSIVLKANPQNTKIARWEYLSAGEWKHILKQGQSEDIEGNYLTETTLTVTNDSAYFDGNNCTIRVVATDEPLYDEHSIIKVYAGASGTSTIVSLLTNEDQMIAFDKNGKAVKNAYADAWTKLSVYKGNTDVTSELKEQDVVITKTSSIIGNWNFEERKYTVTSITGSGSVNFVITYGGVTMSKTFSLTKIQAGADGKDAVTYSLRTSSLVVNKNSKNELSPSTITLMAEQTIGGEKIPYSGRFTVEVKKNTAVTTYKSPSEQDITNSDASIATWSVAEDDKELVFRLYESGNTTTLLDTQTVVIVTDGIKGDTGNAGDDGLTLGLGNYGDQVPCTENGVTANTTDYSIPFFAFQGIARVPVEASVTSWPNGVTQVKNDPGTEVADGKLVIRVGADSTLNGKENSILEITLTATINIIDPNTSETVAQQKSAKYRYSLSKNLQGISGVNAITLQAYATKGGVLIDGVGEEVLEAQLYSGGTKVTQGVSYVWSKWENKGTKSAYVPVENGTNASLTVKASSVDSFASYQIAATYKGQTHLAYVSILDKSDPLQIYMFSTLGDKITNGKGEGCVYARVYQNGTELDALKNLVVSHDQPVSASKGDIWVEINKGIKVKQYNGSAWEGYPENYKCAYNWGFVGDKVPQGLLDQASNRFIYVDGELINKKTQFNLDVTYPKV